MQIFKLLNRFVMISLALLGFSSAAQAVLLHGVEDFGHASNLVTIDSVTGQVATVGQLPFNCLAGEVCGLTGWDRGTLLYTGEIPELVQEIDPTNAGLLNSYHLPVNASGGLSYDSDVDGGRLFSANPFPFNFPSTYVAQQGLDGPLLPGFGNPVFRVSAPGAMGGDDNGRHFVSGDVAGISEFDPITGAIIRTFPRFTPNASGLAFDGISLFAVSLGFPELLELNPNDGTPIRQIRLNIQGSLTALAYLPPSAVPVPAAVWLFGTALMGLVGFGRRKARLAA